MNWMKEEKKTMRNMVDSCLTVLIPPVSFAWFEIINVSLPLSVSQACWGDRITICGAKPCSDLLAVNRAAPHRQIVRDFSLNCLANQFTFLQKGEQISS